MKKLICVAAAVIIALSGLAFAKSKTVSQKKAADGDVEVVQVERLPKLPMSAAAVAFSALAGKVHFDQKLFVDITQATDKTCKVELYKVTAADAHRAEPATGVERKVAEVRIGDSKVEVDVVNGGGNVVHDAFVDESAVAAVVYLASLGGNEHKFTIDATLDGPSECNVFVMDAPLVPGGYCMVTVTKSGMTLAPGV